MKNILSALLTFVFLFGSAGVSESAVTVDCGKMRSLYKIDSGGNYTSHRKTSGNYATALRELTPLAEQGDAKSQYQIGVMYENGRGVPMDYKTALKWFRLAAEQGNACAQNDLGGMYSGGLGVKTDGMTAFKWTKLAAEQGHSGAQDIMNISVPWWKFWAFYGWWRFW